MQLLPLDIPAGVYRVGTEFQSAGRWRDANLVRWQKGSLRPVGGWRQKADSSSAITAAPRTAHSWVDNTAGTNTAIGTASELVYINASGTAYDITPSGFTTGNEDASVNTAFGGNYFNTGLYGVRRPSDGEFQECDTWSLDNWGEYLVGCATSDGKVYEWQLNTSTAAAQVSNAPTSCAGIVVTEERFIFALQADGNPRKIAWCDREDNTTWTAADTNEAGDIELQTHGEIMCAARMRGRMIVLTNTDAHIATYQGPPYVYGFERVGSACGAVSRRSLISVDEGAFWMGRDAFYVFDGSTAKQIDCDVYDYVFEGMNSNQSSKVNAVHNSIHSEVWWFFPSTDSLECDSYVSYNYVDNVWMIGKIDRTCGFDQGVFDAPVWFDASGVSYEHEIRNASHGSSSPYAESGPIYIGQGDQVMRVNQVITDEKTAGDVDLTFKTRFHPNDDERTYGPYTIDGHPTPVRFSGRQVRMRIEAANNNDFRVGVMRLSANQGGKR